VKNSSDTPAINCDRDGGPSFCDIGVGKNCNTEESSWTACFGTSYNDNTGTNGVGVFTNADYFRVQEIEVFKIVV
jgi:hypothetical protein